jgi:hypothetical protein
MEWVVRIDVDRGLVLFPGRPIRVDTNVGPRKERGENAGLHADHHGFGLQSGVVAEPGCCGPRSGVDVIGTK